MGPPPIGVTAIFSCLPFPPPPPKSSTLVSRHSVRWLGASDTIELRRATNAGGYWEQGRVGPDSLYDLVPFPREDGWEQSSFVRHKFDQTDSSAHKSFSKDKKAPPETVHFPITMIKDMDLEGIRNQVRTWSSVHTYMDKNKPERNIADHFVDTLKPDLPEKGAFQAAWPLGLLLMKKAG